MESEQAEVTRLPLLERASLHREQADVYEMLEDTLLPWAKEAGFQAQIEGGRLLGPFNAMLYSPEMGTAHLQYLAKERDATGLDARTREVVILTVGAVCQSEYELYAHRAVAQKIGLAKADIDALATGAEPQTLSSEELIAHRFVRALTADHRVPQALFEEAKQAFGLKCLVDMLHLVGLYLATSAMLNAFEVPVPR